MEVLCDGLKGNVDVATVILIGTLVLKAAFLTLITLPSLKEYTYSLVYETKTCWKIIKTFLFLVFKTPKHSWLGNQQDTLYI